MVNQQFTPQQRQAFEAFAEYPWDSDGVFQAGLENIIAGLPKEKNSGDNKPTKLELQNRQLLRAKHFFFTRFRQNFDLDEYLDYEKYKNIPVEESPAVKAYRRLEVYDFENDTKFLAGLPTIVRGWVKQQQEQGNWDKARMDEEYIRAKAFYYASCVEPVHVGDYIAWTKDRKEASQPACPYAHMWQNKKRSGDAEDETSNDGNSFASTEEPKLGGAATITFSGPKSGNVLTIDRLGELSNQLEKAENSKRVTSRVLRPVATSTSTFSVSTMDTRNGQTTVKDGKCTSVGLAFAETASKVGKDDTKNLVASLDAVADAYYNFVLDTFQQQKTTVTVFDAAIPNNAPYVGLWHGFVRVITEDTFLDMGLQLSYAPVPPLLLLSLCRPRMQSKQPLAPGTELYLALAPPELVRLRAPELLRLGLADVFVPDARLKEAVDGVKRMAMCPEPDTAMALQLVLAAYHSYPGPDRLGVWEKEIQQTFGSSKTLEELKTKLKGMDTRWSNKILDHWKSLPPALVEAVFKGVKSCSEMDPVKVLDLERQLNCRWRRTKEFERWHRQDLTTADTMDSESVDFFFKESEKTDAEDNATTVVYEAPKEDTDDTVAVCPITGQRSDGAAVCPITGQKETDKCPVTGQSSTATGAACPVTGQRQEEHDVSACPVAGKKVSDAQTMVCPVTRQQAASCPVTGQQAEVQ
ncbi:hypothetical protein BDB00DRAFT_876866 [Zychaea mexicana]|uniref:uncharacterized protein n=1 Tax=Zychaea mexicana TaxID=64656 RepID=UPI0022FE413B|nr:uncharacterized protein BDB00DRAFT_876866 [Zychaea mexicana]KAI9488982.1 hypothetical protein BDB00DRAFT_876866 [Zychaea mexicana]